MAPHPALTKFQEGRSQSLQNRVADWITEFAGSMVFVYVHIVWFAAWIILGAEDYPFGLLTMIVSLEAIFLSTFVLIGQNRQSDFAQRKAEHDFQVQEQELLRNTELTQTVHDLVTEIHAHVVSRPT